MNQRSALLNSAFVGVVGIYMEEIIVAVKGILIKNNKILIVKRSENAVTGAGTWETIGGKLTFGETLEHSLQREFKEETGIDALPVKLLYTTTFFTSWTRQVVLIAYLCESKSEDVTLSSEHSDYKWATITELKHYLPKSILNDFERFGVFALIPKMI